VLAILVQWAPRSTVKILQGRKGQGARAEKITAAGGGGRARP
jgi:hypothetical protein